jgi:hypothetical protein
MGGRRNSHTDFAEIRRVADCLSKLAQRLDMCGSDRRVLTLWRRDFDLILRHADTTAIFHIIVPPSGPPRWRQYVLTTLGSASGHSAGPLASGELPE